MASGWNRFIGRRTAAEEDRYQRAFVTLRQRFPELQPIKRGPTLIRVNGIGLTVYGRRGGDLQTRTYIKTQTATFVFIPVFMLAAYRVSDAESGGWYFLGREPLSPFARA
jgi:hypothetical protein